MQKLFSSAKTSVKLKDIATVKDGTHGTYNRVNNGVYLLSAKNIFDGYLDITPTESMISEEDYKTITSNGYPQNGDILLSCVGTIGRCCIYNGIKAAFQRSVAFIRTNTNNKYMLYLLQLDKTQKQLKAASSASAQGGIYLGAIENIDLIVHKDKKEQTAIASILSDMDNEIEALEEKLAKTRQLKQGMMQELLTGRIRLV